MWHDFTGNWKPMSISDIRATLQTKLPSILFFVPKAIKTTPLGIHIIRPRPFF
jgi:hypothetical protein